MAAASSSTNAASMILMFLRLNLFLNLRYHPLLAVKGLVSFSVPSFFWKSSYRLNAFCHSMLPSVGTLFLFISSTQKFKGFSTFINTVSHAIAVTFAVCGATEKWGQVFSLFFITSQIEDSFLPYNLAISTYDFFSISIISRIFIFSLMERTSWLS